MDVIFGLLAAACFGTADFLVTGAARRLGVLVTFTSLQVLGLLSIGVVLAFDPTVPDAPALAWLAMVLAAGISFAGTLLLYRAFAVGTLAVVSPVASGFVVVTALLALGGGERPAGLALLGAVLLVLGVGIVTGASGAVSGGRGPVRARLAGLPEALGATLCLGLYFWALGQLTPVLGTFWPVLVVRVVQLGLGLVVVSRWRESATVPPLRLLPPPRLLPLLAGAAILDTAALLAFNLGAERGLTTIVTALASLYSAVTVLLAWAILRERLAAGQWAGIGVILGGVLLVNL